MAVPNLMPSQSPTEDPLGLSVRAKIYLWLTAVFVTALLAANVLGVKLFSVNVGGIAVTHTCGMLIFPVTFVLTDLLNDYFGRAAARRVTYIAFTMGALMFVAMSVSLEMPYLEAPFNVTRETYERVFAQARIMYVASLAAFLIGSLLDIWVFGLFKRATGGRFIWLRATGSTVISQVFDSLIVTTLAFHFLPRWVGADQESVTPLASTLSMAATGYVLKFVLAVALTPVIYLGHVMLRSWFGMTPLAARTT
jgi:queuosine precursor transporter